MTTTSNTIMQAYTLRGDYVAPGIDPIVNVATHHYAYRGSQDCVILTTTPDGAGAPGEKDGITRVLKVDPPTLKGAVTAYIMTAPDHAGDNKPTRELVLVQQYQPGTGRKRYPAFWVAFEEFEGVQVIGEINPGPLECWRLVTAPIGWAHDVASRFDPRRDAPARQTITPMSTRPVTACSQAPKPSAPKDTGTGGLRLSLSDLLNI